MIRKTYTVAMGLCLSVGVGAGGCSDEGVADDVVTSALTGQVPVAFQGSDNFLWVDQSGPGTALNTFLGMKPGTVPSQANMPNGGLALGFQSSTGHFFYDTFTMGAVDTNLLMASATSPSIVVFNSGTVGFAFQGSNGHLWISNTGTGGGLDTGLIMAGGSSPSMAHLLVSYAVAYRGSNGDLWYLAQGQPALDTGMALAAGTNPSIVGLTDNTHYAIAFQAPGGSMWFTMTAANGNPAFFDTGLGMKAGTSPAVSARGPAFAPIADVAFQANTGEMWVFTDNNGSGSAGSSSIVMANTRSPTIVSTGSGFQAASKSFNGNLAVDLNGSIQDQGVVMN